MPLPEQPTPLLGRERAVEACRSELQKAQQRLITLTGPGGSGKTRLAVEVARRVSAETPDGVYFVDCVPIRDARLVIGAIAKSLGLRESGQPWLGLVEDHLRDRATLLVIDNLEHVQSAADDIATLLSRCPRVKVLATSRESLRIRWEHEFLVPPLELADPEHLPSLAQLADIPSVALFVGRACAVQPEFKLAPNNAAAVARLCAQVDGLPLGIELVAAWSKMLSPEALCDPLRGYELLRVPDRGTDIPNRHRTLEAAIRWSYELLQPGEQRVLRELSVFVGGWRIAAAEAVCTSGSDILNGLAALVDKNLVVARSDDGGDRFSLLETIRDFATEELRRAGEGDEAQCRHAVHFLDFTERLEPYLYGPPQVETLRELDLEHANLRAALNWCMEHMQESAMRLARAIAIFWLKRGHFAEGRAWLERVLNLTEAAPRTVLRGMLLNDLAVLSEHSQVPGDRIIGWYAEAADIGRETGDLTLLQRSLSNVGSALMEAEGDYAGAEPVLEESLHVARAHGSVNRQAHSLGNLAVALYEQGKNSEALLRLEECLSLRRGFGDAWNLAGDLCWVGQMRLRDGDTTGAQVAFQESLGFARQVGDRRHITAALVALARVRLELLEPDSAHELLHEAIEVAASVGDGLALALCLEGFALFEAQRGNSDAATDLVRGATSLRRASASKRAPSFAAYLERSLLASGAAAAAALTDEDVSLTAHRVDELIAGLLLRNQAEPAPRSEAPRNTSLLTARELEVARLIGRGMRNLDIAEALVITRRTTENHVSHILDKLGLESRTQIAAWALQTRLVENMSVANE